MEKNKFSRRGFLKSTAAGAAVGAVSREGTARWHAPPTSPRDGLVPATEVELTVNGRLRRLKVEDRCTVAEMLRDHLRLTGTKLGCERGECGACTVLLDEKPIYSCSYLAVWAHGSTLETVEGLARGGRLHPLQEAFVEHDAPQCGFCTSGQLMSAKALLERNPRPDAAEIKAALVGNLCRCSNYNHYVKAVSAAAEKHNRGGR